MRMYKLFIHANILDITLQGRRDDFESGGPDINIEKVGPYRPKKWGGPTICFTLFPPKSGGARAPPAHTLTTPLCSF